MNINLEKFYVLLGDENLPKPVEKRIIKILDSARINSDSFIVDLVNDVKKIKKIVSAFQGKFK